MTFVIYKLPQCQFDGRDVCGVPLIWRAAYSLFLNWPLSLAFDPAFAREWCQPSFSNWPFFF